MNSDSIEITAVGNIDDDLILEAQDYCSHKNTKYRIYAIVACLIAVSVFVVFSINQYKNPFTVTAYALEIEHSNEMTLNESVPVSLFETSGGYSCFVFSYNQINVYSEQPTITVINNGDFINNIGSIIGLVPQEDNNYFIYIADSHQESLEFTLSIKDENNNKYVIYDFSIFLDNDSYLAEITNVNILNYSDIMEYSCVSDQSMYVFNNDGEIVYMETNPKLVEFIDG